MRTAAAGLVLAAVGAGCVSFEPAPPGPYHQEREDARAGIAQAQGALGGRTLGVPGYAHRTSTWGGAYPLGYGLDEVHVYWDDDDLPVFVYRDVALHEYGHVWDIKRFNDWSRARVLQITGWSGPWFGGAHEHYADAYMLAVSPGARAGYSLVPTVDQMAQLKAEGLVP